MSTTKCAQGNTAVLGCRKGYAGLSNLLLKRGAETDSRNMFFETPLLQAASEVDAFNENKYTRTIHLLAESRADVDPICHDTDIVDVYDLLERVITSISRADFKNEMSPEDGHLVRKYWKNRTQSLDGQQLLEFVHRLSLSKGTPWRREWQIGKATPFIWAVERNAKDLSACFGS